MRKNENLQFATIKDAIRFLLAKGWRCSDKSVYRHISQQKLSKPPWTADQLDLYAAGHLQPRVDLQPAKKGNGALHSEASQLIEARRQKIEVDIEAKKFELQIRKGEFVPKDTTDRALARRALILKSDLVNFAHGKAPLICEKIKGDRDYLSDLIQFLGDEFEVLLGRYSGSTEDTGHRDFDAEEKIRVSRNRSFLERGDGFIDEKDKRQFTGE